MRRSLLTLGLSIPPFSFGNPPVNASSTTAATKLYVDNNTVSPASGVITILDYWAGFQNSMYVYTGTVVNNVFTVRDFVNFSISGLGLRSTNVSLNVVANDYFAVWSDSGGTLDLNLANGYMWTAANIFTAPRIGDAVTCSPTTGIPSLKLSSG